MKRPTSSEINKSLNLIHISDIHYGSGHVFTSHPGPDGRLLPTNGLPTFADLVCRQINQLKNDKDVLICITGDITSRADAEGFEDGYKLIEALQKQTSVSLSQIFIVCGNHDIDRTHAQPERRMEMFVNFMNRVYGQALRREDYLQLVNLHNVPADNTRIQAQVLTLNSSDFIDENHTERGMIDFKQLQRVEELFKAQLDEEAVKIALIHHHPILIPQLVEPGRGYDAALNSERLLRLLRKAGFHIILHGHKHTPFQFSTDIIETFAPTEVNTMIVIAGGSAGSSELNRELYPAATNTINQINIKFQKESEQLRVRVETLGLNTHIDGVQTNPYSWSFDNIIYRDDRIVRLDNIRRFKAPKAGSIISRDAKPGSVSEFDFKELLSEEDSSRTSKYLETRGWFPTVEVVPSFMDGQHYEARFWLVQHVAQMPGGTQMSDASPTRVIWSAGPNFPILNINRFEDPTYCGMYHFYGGFLLQGRVEFSDGGLVRVHIYVRMPVAGNLDESSSDEPHGGFSSPHGHCRNDFSAFDA